jgi:hypothetical protein
LFTLFFHIFFMYLHLNILDKVVSSFGTAVYFNFIKLSHVE